MSKYSLTPSRKIIFFLVLFSGMAALSWEAIWQIKSSLALGVSAWGTALTLAVTMGGMCIGAILSGYILKHKTIHNPLKIYAGLEILIGVSGLLLEPAFRAIEKLDSWAYSIDPGSAVFVHLAGIAAPLSLPTICMGATLPVLGLIARQFQTSIAFLYGLNTLGAASGILLVAFVLIPFLGITATIWMIALLNFTVGLIAWTMKKNKNTATKNAETLKQSTKPAYSLTTASIIVFISGFSIFMLEIAWFRSFTATFKSSTDAFAIMLSCVLLALGLGAHLASSLKKRTTALGIFIGWAGILSLLATPVIERFDFFMHINAQYPALLFAQWFFATLYVIGAPILLLGIVLPWILDDQHTSTKQGFLYGFNSLAAALGALCAAWIFLPTIGFARTAWIVGILVALTGILTVPAQKRLALFYLSAAALFCAVIFESGIGKTRVQSTSRYYEESPSKIIEVYEGPEATLSVVEYGPEERFLFIDGFIATGQTNKDRKTSGEHYMPWMGHLPMLLHSDPQNALVICFGTGQTANAVRKENPKSLDIVDINKNIFKLAHNFSSNEKVLEDPRTNTIVMDGRAYIRRTDKTYDVITLEPMPPTFAGVNALYSLEFYQLARSKLGSSGIIAQWLPFHLVSATYGASITKTFQQAFPNAILWLDPPSGTGILVGSVQDDKKIGEQFPGFNRISGIRDLSKNEVRSAIYLNAEELTRYSTYGDIITDNNQLLAYGKASYMLRSVVNLKEENHDLLKKIKTQEK